MWTVYQDKDGIIKILPSTKFPYCLFHKSTKQRAETASLTQAHAHTHTNTENYVFSWQPKHFKKVQRHMAGISWNFPLHPRTHCVWESGKMLKKQKEEFSKWIKPACIIKNFNVISVYLLTHKCDRWRFPPVISLLSSRKRQSPFRR